MGFQCKETEVTFLQYSHVGLWGETRALYTTETFGYFEIRRYVT